MNAAEITRALGGRWRGSYGSARCPAHDDHSPSLSLQDGERGVLVTCHTGCAREAVIDALRGLGLWEGRRAAELPRPKPAAKPSEGPDEVTRTRWALRTWTESRDPRKTVVERYLTSRGLELPDDVALRVLRFHPRLRHQDGATWPAMIGLLRDLRTDKPTGIHRTFLKPDGSGKAPVAKPKMMFGRARNSAIKIDDDDRVTLGLLVGEGVETALASRMLGYRPVWALGCAGAIASLPVLPGIEALTILGEIDKNHTNALAAQACVERWTAAGVDVEVLEPFGGKDANDVLVAR
jgi:putative DNA primase/helicase